MASVDSPDATSRINKVRQALKDNIDKDKASDDVISYSKGIKSRQWGNWGNWGNWNNWANWANWSNWNNWGNYWINY